MPPTETPLPTVTPFPLPGANWYWDMQMNSALTTGAVWAVLILVIAVVMVRPHQRTILVLLIMSIVTSPLMVINASAWVVTLYTFVSLYMLLARLGMVAD